MPGKAFLDLLSQIRLRALCFCGVPSGSYVRVSGGKKA